MQADQEHTTPLLLKTCKVIAWVSIWSLHFIPYSSTKKQLPLAHRQQEQASFISGCQRICFSLDHECSALTLTRCLESSFLHTICKWCYWIYQILSSTQPRGTVCILTCPSEENLLQCPKPIALQVQKVTEREQLLYIAQGYLKGAVEEIEKSSVGVKQVATIMDTEEGGHLKPNQIGLHISSKFACSYMKQL